MRLMIPERPSSLSSLRPQRWQCASPMVAGARRGFPVVCVRSFSLTSIHGHLESTLDPAAYCTRDFVADPNGEIIYSSEEDHLPVGATAVATCTKLKYLPLSCPALTLLGSRAGTCWKTSGMWQCAERTGSSTGPPCPAASVSPQAALPAVPHLEPHRLAAFCTRSFEEDPNGSVEYSSASQRLPVFQPTFWSGQL